MNSKTSHELHELLTSKKISAVELVESVYERIDKVESKVQAYVTQTREEALVCVT